MEEPSTSEFCGSRDRTDGTSTNSPTRSRPHQARPWLSPIPGANRPQDEPLQATTPAPQQQRTGVSFDMIRKSTWGKLPRLDDGQTVRGSLVSGSIVDAAVQLDSRVLVLGRAVYRASGKLLRIDADEIKGPAAEPSLWSRIPSPRTRRFDPSALHVPQGPRSGVSAIVGRWPGDETDDEIAAWLERTSWTSPRESAGLWRSIRVCWSTSAACRRSNGSLGRKPVCTDGMGRPPADLYHH